jgi:hypothetical protein
MIFLLVLKLEISYKVINNNILKDFGFFLEDILKIWYIFCMVKYLSFHNSSYLP